MSLAIGYASWRDWLLSASTAPPPEPLLGELGDSVARTVTPRHKRVTDWWPDPYGPDPVVFGSVPRVGP